MKNTGIIRNIDELGRIVLPKELRKTLAINPGTPLEIFTEDEYLILKKFSRKENVCFFCGSEDNLLIFKGKNICLECKEYIINKDTK